MTKRGDIRSDPYASRAREYMWSRIADVFPRNITPTDFDGVVEQKGCFWVFEGKTIGAKMAKGQERCLREAIEAWPIGRSVLVLGEHDRLDSVDTYSQVRRVQWAWRGTDGRMVWEPRPIEGLGCLWRVVREFSRDAETSRILNPTEWWDRDAHNGRPFADEGEAS